jgi:hypothetical protein
VDNSLQIWAMVRRTLNTDRTAVIFCCGSKLLRVQEGLDILLTYILSRVMHKLFVTGLFLPLDPAFHSPPARITTGRSPCAPPCKCAWPWRPAHIPTGIKNMGAPCDVPIPLCRFDGGWTKFFP